ncbi:CGA synthase-related protein [Streptomyces sp. NPDC048606]|uniref:CGA synthase-related protein n=1 Tax=Streptomyces sp. NPDC048606 TaxID=3154726 RepID=UPI00342DC904
MALLNPAPAGPPAADGDASPDRRVLLSAAEDRLDSVLALARVAAHLGDLRRIDWSALDPPPAAALVCDDVAATERLLELGVPVVHLDSGHPQTTAGGVAPGRALVRVHRPGWLAPSGPTVRGVRPTGVLAPRRTGRSRSRSGALVMLSLWGVPEAEADGYVRGALPELVRAALERTGGCTVVVDTGLARVRAALTERPEARVLRAADADPDALHAGAAVFLASPTLGPIALAQARRAPLALLAPLGTAQRELARRVDQVLPLPSAVDPHDPGLWAPGAATGPWHLLDPALDDLRGAQRVARTLRQLALAPL